MKKTISVIIPVYGTEKYLRKCLSSVVNQTYGNIEVIVVNDCTPDHSQSIIDEYVEKYEYIQCVKLEKNRGLFHARLAGFDVATGDYIAFLDSDDYLAEDAYRAMIEKAETTQSDIVFGNIVIEWEADGRKETHIYNEPLFDRLEGSQIVARYLDQEGYTFFWYAVWNKIFSKEIFDQARPFFDRITEHTIMAEDVAFCSILLAMADRISCIDYYSNYYLQSQTSSTSRGADLGKYLKNIKDMCRVMDFVEIFVMEYPRYEECKDKFHRFKEVFVLYWRTSISRAMFSKKKKKVCLKALKKYSRMSQMPDHAREGDQSLTYAVDRSFIYNQLAIYNPRYEEIIQEISQPANHTICFPFEEILFQANVLEADDFFVLLERDYKALCPECTAGECMSLRKACLVGDRKITIDEIYHEMTALGLERSLCQALKSREIKLIQQLYTRRESVKQLYDLAVYLGKNVLIQIDNHFDETMVKDMLEVHGYEGYQELISESDIGSKDGTLSFYSTEEPDPDKMTDELGLIAYPKATSVLLQKCGMFNYLRKSQTCNEDFFGNLLNKSSLALAANLYFDNPFRPFDKKTDFNRDAYLMGLLPISMFYLNLARWLMAYEEYQEIYIDKSSRHLMDVVSNYLELTDYKFVLKEVNLANRDALDSLESPSDKAAFFGIYKSLLSQLPVMDKIWVYGDSSEKSNGSDAMVLFLDSSLPKVVEYLLGAFEEGPQAFYSEKLINRSIRMGVMDFTSRMLAIYPEQVMELPYDNRTMVYPFEYLLHKAKYKDIGLFYYCSLYFEKKNEIEEMSLFTYWLQVNLSKADQISGKVKIGGNGIGYYPFLNNKSAMVKAFFFLFFDQDTLYEKLKIRFGANKRVYRMVDYMDQRRAKRNGGKGD